MLAALILLQLLFGLTFTHLYFRERRRRQIVEHQRDFNAAAHEAALAWLEKIEREHAERRSAICAIITRRPPRRRWLRMAYRVAKLAS